MKKNLLFFVLFVSIYWLGFYSRQVKLHPVKHTQVAQCVYRNGHTYWFVRPNGELFSMYFDNPPEIIYQNLKLKDLVYVDDNGWMQHFISARLPEGPHNGQD